MSERIAVQIILEPLSCKFCKGTYQLAEEEGTQDVIVMHSLPSCMEFLKMNPEEYLKAVGGGCA